MDLSHIKPKDVALEFVLSRPWIAFASFSFFAHLCGSYGIALLSPYALLLVLLFPPLIVYELMRRKHLVEKQALVLEKMTCVSRLPSHESVIWLNMIITKFLHNEANFISKTVLGCNPMITEKAPPVLAGTQLSVADLGKRGPWLRDFRVTDIGGDRLAVDVAMDYSSDMNIVADVVVKEKKIPPVSVTAPDITADLRLVLQLIPNTNPLVSIASVQFLDILGVDVPISVGPATVTDTPLIQALKDSLINAGVGSLVHYPEKLDMNLLKTMNIMVTPAELEKNKALPRAWRHPDFGVKAENAVLGAIGALGSGVTGAVGAVGGVALGGAKALGGGAMAVGGLGVDGAKALGGGAMAVGGLGVGGAKAVGGLGVDGAKALGGGAAAVGGVGAKALGGGAKALGGGAMAIGGNAVSIGSGIGSGVGSVGKGLGKGVGSVGKSLVSPLKFGSPKASASEADVDAVRLALQHNITASPDMPTEAVQEAYSGSLDDRFSIFGLTGNSFISLQPFFGSAKRLVAPLSTVTVESTEEGSVSLDINGEKKQISGLAPGKETSFSELLESFKAKSAGETTMNDSYSTAQRGPTPEDWATLEDKVEVKHFDADAQVIATGSKDKVLYQVVSGSVICNCSGKQVSRLSVSDVFGEYNFASNDGELASFVAGPDGATCFSLTAANLPTDSVFGSKFKFYVAHLLAHRQKQYQSLPLTKATPRKSSSMAGFLKRASSSSGKTHFKCSLKRPVLDVHGDLFLDNASINFHGKLFGSKTKLWFPVTSPELSVQSTSKTITVSLGSKSYVFESFKKTSSAEKYIKEYIKKNKSGEAEEPEHADEESHLSEADWDILLQNATLTDYSSGKSIITEGDQPKSIHQLAHGKLNVETHRGSDRRKSLLGGKPKPHILAVLEDGAIFGELSYLEHSTSVASVVATEDSKVYALDLDSVHSHLDKDADLADRFYSHLSSIIIERIAHVVSKL